MFGIGEINDFINPEKYKFAFEKLFLWLPLCIFSVIIFVTVFVPRFLLKKKYFHFGIASLLMFAINMTIAYFFANLYFNYIYVAETHHEPPADFRPLGTVWLIYFHGLILSGSISVLAAGIKFGKFLYLQEIENTRLVKEKNDYEIKVVKGRMQPAFLLRSLNSVCAKIHNKDPNAPYVILRLSDLLSYILYDSAEPMAPLKTEIEMTLSSIEMEKINPENYVELFLEINGEVEDLFITPLQLFTHVQHVMQQVSTVKTRQSMLINIDVADNYVKMRLSRDLVNWDFIHNIQNLRNQDETIVAEEELRIALLPVNTMQINN